MSKNNPISVVISTRKKDENYIKEVRKAFSHPDTEIIVYENDDQYSLTRLYNKGLDESKYDIVAFIHDDLIFDTPNISAKIEKLFNNNPEYGIIGLAGTTEMTTGIWWEKKEMMVGQVRHEYNGRIHRNNYSGTFGEALKEVVVVDGLFFAVHKKRIVERFDDQFTGFHFYEISFCVLNFKKGVKIGVTTKILVTHKSIGETNKKWEKNRLFFLAKYEKDLPLKVE